jgi:hypothetical protein
VSTVSIAILLEIWLANSPLPKLSGTCRIFVDGLRYLTAHLGKYNDAQRGNNLNNFPAPESVGQSPSSA